MPLQIICIGGLPYEDIPNKKPLPSQMYPTQPAVKGSTVATVGATQQTITINNQTDGNVRATFVGKKSSGKLRARQKTMLLKKGINTIEMAFMVSQINFTFNEQEKNIKLNENENVITITANQDIMVS